MSILGLPEEYVSHHLNRGGAVIVVTFHEYCGMQSTLSYYCKPVIEGDTARAVMQFETSCHLSTCDIKKLHEQTKISDCTRLDFEYRYLDEPYILLCYDHARGYKSHDSVIIRAMHDFARAVMSREYTKRNGTLPGPLSIKRRPIPPAARAQALTGTPERTIEPVTKPVAEPETASEPFEPPEIHPAFKNIFFFGAPSNRQETDK